MAGLLKRERSWSDAYRGAKHSVDDFENWRKAVKKDMASFKVKLDKIGTACERTIVELTGELKERKRKRSVSISSCTSWEANCSRGSLSPSPHKVSLFLLLNNNSTEISFFKHTCTSA